MYKILEINILLWNFIMHPCPQFVLFYVLMDYLKTVALRDTGWIGIPPRPHHVITDALRCY